MKYVIENLSTGEWYHATNIDVYLRKMSAILTNSFNRACRVSHMEADRILKEEIGTEGYAVVPVSWYNEDGKLRR